MLVGRGAVDMKGAIAAFIAAAERAIAVGQVKGSPSFLITGDEEGVAVDGTRKVVEALLAEGETVDHCIVGEPTSAAELGDMVKVGRRGSINAQIVVHGTQGHVAYPHRAANPARVLVPLLARLQARVLDQGYPEFQPSNLEVTRIEMPNTATNIIPATARAWLNIRFNPAHSGQALADWIAAEAERAAEGSGCRVEVGPQISGEAFLTERGPFTELVQTAVAEACGRTPELSTSGGTSDARFIRALCPVVEFGLVGTTMHAVDERTPTAEIVDLARAYQRIVVRYFERFSS
jgi:succinyl-diaminopimelate desuccinylase